MSRRATFGAIGLALLATLTTGGVWWLYAEVGRTPGEIIRYTKRRLEGHPRLELVALPVLDQLRDWFGAPDEVEQHLPFTVPPLPPNPAAGRGGVGLRQEPAAPGARSDADIDDRIIRVGATRAITRIAVAARMAKDGDTIEIDPGDYYADVAVWDRSRITIRGMGPRVRLIAAGANAEGKAIWVIRRGSVTIENIDFIGARVSDRNGAGIRFESGQLTVRRCLFFDNETGILTGGGPETRMDIEDSEFAYNGFGDGLSHHIYVGDMKSLRVTGSYFHHANMGHLIKSRAQESHIAYNRITDESGGRASYELEFPDGGVALVIGNIIQQGAQTQNSVLVSFGAEGYKWPRNEIRLAYNTLVNDHRDGGTFLRVSPGADRVVTRNNLFAGKGRWVSASEPVDSAGDAPADWSLFVRPSREDYRLNDKARRDLGASGIAAGPFALIPQAEYEHPMRVRRLNAPPTYPGALQTPGN